MSLIKPFKAILLWYGVSGRLARFVKLLCPIRLRLPSCRPSMTYGGTYSLGACLFVKVLCAYHIIKLTFCQVKNDMERWDDL